jgi:hypothetical protein
MHRKNLFIWVGVALALILVASVPLWTLGLKKKGSLNRTFSEYAQALTSGNYQAAYGHSDSEFRSLTDLPTFIAQHKELETAFGRLETVSNENIAVEGRGSPLEWVGIVEADLHFHNKTIRVNYELHFVDDRWLVHGYRRE